MTETLWKAKDDDYVKIRRRLSPRKETPKPVESRLERILRVPSPELKLDDFSEGISTLFSFKLSDAKIKERHKGHVTGEYIEEHEIKFGNSEQEMSAQIVASINRLNAKMSNRFGKQGDFSIKYIPTKGVYLDIKNTAIKEWNEFVDTCDSIERGMRCTTMKQSECGRKQLKFLVEFLSIIQGIHTGGIWYCGGKEKWLLLPKLRDVSERFYDSVERYDI